MNCCVCKKEIDLESGDSTNQKWYGKYNGQKLEKVICADCIKDPEKKKVYIGTVPELA